MAQIKPFEKPIHVKRPPLPDRAAVYRKIDEIWDSQWLTNVGYLRLLDLRKEF
jgi:hypothetical protein